MILPGSTLLLFSSLLLSTLLLPRLLFSSLAYSTQVASIHLYCALLLYTLLYSFPFCSSLISVINAEVSFQNFL